MKLAIDNAEVSLAGRKVIDRASLVATSGELICLLGPNGAGKTTLLRTLAGLTSFDGVVAMDERDLATLSARERAAAITYLPQSGPIHWPLKARDVVAIGRLPHSSSLTVLSEADEQAIDKALHNADAHQFADRLVTELSGGERARVLLARALAVESPVLLVDEPLAALDPEHQLGCLARLAGLAQQDRLVIAAVHDIALASRFATRIIVMNDGRIVADGTPADVLVDELLREVFAIEAARLEHHHEAVILPWQRIVQSRDK